MILVRHRSPKNAHFRGMCFLRCAHRVRLMQRWMGSNPTLRVTRAVWRRGRGTAARAAPVWLEDRQTSEAPAFGIFASKFSKFSHLRNRPGSTQRLVSRAMEVTVKKFPLFLTSLAALFAVSATAQNNEANWQRSQIRHVLLISVDGLHAVDYLNCTHGIAAYNNGMP